MIRQRDAPMPSRDYLLYTAMNITGELKEDIADSPGEIWYDSSPWQATRSHPNHHLTA